MEQYPQRRFWMLGPMVVVALVLGVLLGKGWERTGHATETYEELKTFSEGVDPSSEELRRRNEGEGPRPGGHSWDALHPRSAFGLHDAGHV